MKTKIKIIRNPALLANNNNYLQELHGYSEVYIGNDSFRVGARLTDQQVSALTLNRNYDVTITAQKSPQGLNL